VVHLLRRLVSTSLVQVAERAGQSRYALLETVREYALEQLEASGESARAQMRHLGWCVTLAEEAEVHLNGPAQAQWLGRLDTEHDNLRAALSWARERGAVEQGLRLAGALWQFWRMHGHLSEGRGWLEGLQAQAESGPVASAVAVRAKAQQGAAVLAWAQADYGQATALGESSLELYRAAGDRRGMATALNTLGNVAREQGDFARAAALHQEGLALRRELGDKRGVAISLNNLGNVAQELGDYARAVALYEESLALKRELGDTWGIAGALNNLGLVAQELGDPARARALYEESLALKRELGDTWGVAGALHNLGGVAQDLGDYARAAALHAESLRLAQELGDRLLVAVIVEGLAGVAAAQGRARRAARLFGAAEAWRDALGMPPRSSQRADRDRAAQGARAAVGEAAWTAAWTAGRGLTIEQAIVEALNDELEA
jgi:tetratricopeptide (TPR) repeat protein